MGATEKIVISEYSEYTGPRYYKQGNSSGEDFYHKVLNISFAKALQSNCKLIVDLDNTAGYLSSFLDEAFGNLVFDFTLEKVKPNISFISKQEPDWIDMITNEVFVDWEGRRKRNKLPIKTTPHTEWYRFINNKLEKKIWIKS